MDFLEFPKIGRLSRDIIITEKIDGMPRRMRMVTLTEREVDELASPTGSIHLSFFGVSLGALVAFGICLATVEITNPKIYAMFIALAAVALIASLYFGTNAVVDVSRQRKRVKDIKAGLSSEMTVSQVRSTTYGRNYR